MTIANISTGAAPVTVTGDTVNLCDLSVTHAEAASLVRQHLDESGTDAAVDLVRRALPVGLVALSMGTAAVDTGALTRTLDTFAERVDAKSQSALAGLDRTLDRLRAGEETVARVAGSILENLPSRVEAALAGQAGSVRASVAEAARAVQAAGLQELTAALSRHSDSVRDALSLDREGPVRMLRQDLLQELNSTRREIGEQLALVRTLVEAAQAAKVAGAKSSRAVGAANEAATLAMLREVVTAAGDLFEATGGQPGAGGTTRRTGDGVATLSPAITGPGRKVRIVLEAKHRSRPMTAKNLRDEITTGCRVREAAGGLVVVPTCEEVPGGGSFARLDTTSYVVAASDADAVSLIYLLVREQVALLTIRQEDGAEVDLAALEARLKVALEGLTEFDEVGRLAAQAQKCLERLIDVGGKAKQKVKDNLTNSITMLHI